MRRSRRFPTFIDAIFNSSIALEQLERHDEALVRCDRVLAIDPRHARALANRGNAASHLERYRDAADSYARALDVEPRSTGVLCNYASALMRIERHDDARDMCDRALALDAGYVPASSRAAGCSSRRTATRPRSTISRA